MSQPFRLGFLTHIEGTGDSGPLYQEAIELFTAADELGFDLKGHKCKGIEGIIDEGEQLLKAKADADVRDAGLIGAAQRVEHYEIAGYGTARTFARRLGHDRAAELLQQTLEEEGNTDQRLTRIAESMVNRDAQR